MNERSPSPSEAARTSLLGLAVGDAFGTMLDGYGPELARRAAKRLISMKRPWGWTDDTAMAVSIVELLVERGTIDPDALAAAFVRRFEQEPNRGYGAGAFDLLSRVSKGASWRDEASGLFRGKGSFGNGAAMRAAPIGAFFAPDLERVRIEALRSAEPTHAHPDGAAGAVAVAIAAALASTRAVPRDAMLGEVARWTPEGATHDGLLRAEELGLAFDVGFAGEELGSTLDGDRAPGSRPRVERAHELRRRSRHGRCDRWWHRRLRDRRRRDPDLVAGGDGELPV